MKKKSDDSKTIKISVEGKDRLPLEKLLPFQGALKHIEKTEYESLRKTLLDFGFSFVVHVWKDKGKFHVIDGHQRIFVLNQMKKVEGWTIPDLPVALVKADSFAEAKRKVLAAASQYGKVTKDSLASYLRESDIQFDEIVANFHFPEIDFSDMAEQFSQDISGAVSGTFDSTIEDGSSSKTSLSGSSQVKQLNLFFSSEDYSEFIKLVEKIQTDLKQDNISDTLLEIVKRFGKLNKK
jgi:hypothetical protein